jgi:hypothetical protein
MGHYLWSAESLMTHVAAWVGRVVFMQHNVALSSTSVWPPPCRLDHWPYVSLNLHWLLLLIPHHDLAPPVCWLLLLVAAS